MAWQRWEMRFYIVRLCLLHDLMRVWAADADFFFLFLLVQRTSVAVMTPRMSIMWCLPACLPAMMMMMNHQISGFEIIIPKSFVVM